MSDYKVVLFDIGGVLLTNGWDRQERAAVLERFGLDRAEFEQRHGEPYRAWEAGAIPVWAYLDATVFYKPRPFTPEEFFNAILAQSKPLEDSARGILEEIAASKKYLVGALNNEPYETNEYRLETFGLRHFLQVALSSCYLGLRKPAPAIYRRAIDILGCRPAEIVFIDDRLENAGAARQAGMHSIVFRGAGPLREELMELGVLEEDGRHVASAGDKR